MRQASFFFLLTFFVPVLVFAAPTIPIPAPTASLTVPIAFAVSNKPTVFYLPNTCSGLIGDAMAGDGVMDIAVQGRILNGQLTVHLKVDFRGTAQTTVGSVAYNGNGALSVFEARPMATEPLDIFIKGVVVFTGKSKSQKLYLGDIGYITVYPDGSVVNHIMDPNNAPALSRPIIHCSKPAGV